MRRISYLQSSCFLVDGITKTQSHKLLRKHYITNSIIYFSIDDIEKNELLVVRKIFYL